MGPEYVVPCGLLKGSEVWALGLHRIHKGYTRGPFLKNYPKHESPSRIPFRVWGLGFRV